MNLGYREKRETFSHAMYLNEGTEYIKQSIKNNSVL